MRRRRILLLGVLVVVGLGAAVVWWVGRGEDPPPLSLDDAPAAEGSSAAPDGDVAIDGVWTVVPDSGSQAGLRIEEERGAGLPDNTAVGRTEDVTGSLTLSDATVTEAEFDVDLSTLEFSDDPGIPVADRSQYLRTRALETDRHPEASFALSEPIVVPIDDLTAGRRVTVTATGVLSLHGVEDATTIDLVAELVGDQVRMATRAPVMVRLADHDIERPVIEGISEVAAEGSFELLVILERT